MSNLSKIENKQVTTVTPAQMLQIAVEQNADIEKLEKLMDLQERWEQNAAKKSFVAAMSAFRRDCPSIDRTKKAHNSSYAGLAETLQQINELLADNGLSHDWETTQKDGLVSVTCNVTHIDGYSKSTTLTAEPDTTGSKNAIQSVGSAVSYLQRYTLFAILGLASKEADTDGNPAQCLDAIAQIQAAADEESLKELYVRAYKNYPKHRVAITKAKDGRKKELQNDLKKELQND